MIEDILLSYPKSFTVDNTVKTVALAAPVAHDSFETYGAGKWIMPNDNIIIKSISVNLPYAFISGTGPFTLAILGEDSAGVTFVLNSLGAASHFSVHSENVEIDRNQYCPFSSSPTGLKYFLKGIVYGTVCCLNAPAILNAEVLSVSSVIKVQHTLALT